MKDNLRPAGEALFEEFGRLCSGHPSDEVISAAMNIVLNVVRQHTAGRREAEATLNEVHGKAMSALLSHYDPVTNRRRSVVPFDQVLNVGHTQFQTTIRGLGGKNGSS